MKKKLSLLLCLLLAATPAALAQGMEIDGTIEVGSVMTITAPYTGTVGDYTAGAGDVFAAGDALFPLSVTTVYAEMDGVDDIKYLEGTKQTTSLAWVWVLIVLLAAGVITMILMQG